MIIRNCCIVGDMIGLPAFNSSFTLSEHPISPRSCHLYHTHPYPQPQSHYIRLVIMSPDASLHLFMHPNASDVDVHVRNAGGPASFLFRCGRSASRSSFAITPDADVACLNVCLHGCRVWTSIPDNDNIHSVLFFLLGRIALYLHSRRVKWMWRFQRLVMMSTQALSR